jgi:hypothetical protein
MAQTMHLEAQGASPWQRLIQTGQWLVDAAGTGLGFIAPQDAVKPPMIGAQTFSGRISHPRRNPFRRRGY